MATFAYTARTRGGDKVEGVIEAHDRRTAMVQIEALGHVPVSVREGVAAPVKVQSGARFTWRRGSARLGLRDMLLFTTELSDLLASGMTVGAALNTLAKRRSGRPGDEIVRGLRDEILRGASLSAAAARYPRTFSQLYVSMISAGEASGTLHEVLQRLVTHFERVQETREKVISALVYPCIVLLMGMGTLVFCMVKVIPQFEVIFADMGETLPASTRLMIAGSGWVVRYGWMALILLTIGVLFALRAVRTERGARWWDGVLLKMPLVRGIVAASVYANFARTLGTLLANGVPALQALGILERTTGNAVIADQIHKARERVTDGTTISGPLAAGKVFPSMMTDMMAIGEQTGDMSGALTHVARRYEGELNRNIKIFTTALEPILIVVVAIMVGFVAISILSAVFSLTNGLNL